MHTQKFTFEVTVDLTTMSEISPEFAAEVFKQMLTENIVKLRHNPPVVTAQK